MTTIRTPSLPAKTWLTARLYWEQDRDVTADDVAARFGTTRAAVKHRITRERWTRGYTYVMAPVDGLCPGCRTAARGRSMTIRLSSPLPSRYGADAGDLCRL